VTITKIPTFARFSGVVRRQTINKSMEMHGVSDVLRAMEDRRGQGRGWGLDATWHVWVGHSGHCTELASLGSRR
jgi:hypothetical protein